MVRAVLSLWSTGVEPAVGLWLAVVDHGQQEQDTCDGSLEET